MRIIWKASLDWTAEEQEVQAPRGATAVHVDVQDRALKVWYICDPTAPMLAHRVRVVGTGEAVIEDHWLYVGTCLVDAYVWHVFEIPEPA